MQSQGAGFPEAVEQLAAEAGLEVPKPSPAAAEAERRRLDLHGVLQPRRRRSSGGCSCRRAARRSTICAVAACRTRPSTASASAGPARGAAALAAELGARGDRAADAGRGRADCAPAEEPGRLNDLFFNRVMFPIRDRRGRVDQLRRPHLGRRASRNTSTARKPASFPSGAPCTAPTWRARRRGRGAPVSWSRATWT